MAVITLASTEGVRGMENRVKAPFVAADSGSAVNW
jgi:hypothetical protein